MDTKTSWADLGNLVEFLGRNWNEEIGMDDDDEDDRVIVIVIKFNLIIIYRAV